MEVFALAPGELKGASVFLKGPEAKHIVKVCRHRVGDVLTFADGEGHFVYARVDRCSGGELHAQIESREEDPREAGAPRLSLVLALLKGDHFELALEKAVELGVHEIVPVQSERCIVRLKDNAGKKRERWQRIAIAAMKQSGRSWCPQVATPWEFGELMDQVEAGSRWVVGDEEVDGPTVGQLNLAPGSSVVAVVGPEGGFSPGEKERLAQAGAEAVTLSPYRLRAETAAITLLSAVAQASAPSPVP